MFSSGRVLACVSLSVVVLLVSEPESLLPLCCSSISSVQFSRSVLSEHVHVSSAQFSSLSSVQSSLFSESGSEPESLLPLCCSSISSVQFSRSVLSEHVRVSSAQFSSLSSVLSSLFSESGSESLSFFSESESKSLLS